MIRAYAYAVDLLTALRRGCIVRSQSQTKVRRTPCAAKEPRLCSGTARGSRIAPLILRHAVLSSTQSYELIIGTKKSASWKQGPKKG